MLPIKIDGGHEKDSGRIRTVFIEPHQEAQSGEFINGGVLVEVFARQSIGTAGGWNELDIELELLSRVGHGGIRFGLVWLLEGLPDQLHPPHHPVEADNVAGIASVP
jgi:hypothetical protein